MSVLYLLAKVYCFSRSLRLLFKVSNADMLCRYYQDTLRKESMSKHIHLSCLLEARHAIIKRGRGTISMAAAILPQAFVEEDSRQRHRRIESSCLIIRVRLLLRRRILILTAAMFVRRPRWRRRSRNKLTCIALFTCFESAEALTDQQETANAMVLYDIVSGMLHTCIRSSMLVRPSHSAFLRLHKKRDLFSLPTSNRRCCVLALVDRARLNNAQANSRLGPKLGDSLLFLSLNQHRVFAHESLRKIVLLQMMLVLLGTD